MNIREAIRASGGLVSLKRAGERCGVSRQRMAQYAGRENFPEPLYADARIRLYLGSDVEQWLREFRGSTLPHQAARAANARSLDQFERGF